MSTPSGPMRCCRPVDVKIGVLALQGDVSEHIDAFFAALRLRGCGKASSVVEVRSPADLAGLHSACDPRGESTTISRLIDKNGLYEPIRHLQRGDLCDLRRYGADGDPCCRLPGAYARAHGYDRGPECVWPGRRSRLRRISRLMGLMAAPFTRSLSGHRLLPLPVAGVHCACDTGQGYRCG